jgi:hypothetical protein
MQHLFAPIEVSLTARRRFQYEAERLRFHSTPPHPNNILERLKFALAPTKRGACHRIAFCKSMFIFGVFDKKHFYAEE